MSRTKKQPYTGAKKVDKSCRNNGSCPYCRRNRMYKNLKKEEVSFQEDGEKIITYLEKYKGSPLYNDIALAIEFGANL